MYGNTHDSPAVNSNKFSIQIGSAGDAFLALDKSLILDWHPKAGDKPLKPRKATAQSANAPVRSRKGKQKAIEDDPIELYEDDSLSLDTFDRFDTPVQDDMPDVFLARSQSLIANPESSSAVEQSVEILYKKMLTLRTNVS